MGELGRQYANWNQTLYFAVNTKICILPLLNYTDRLIDIVGTWIHTTGHIMEQ